MKKLFCFCLFCCFCLLFALSSTTKILPSVFESCSVQIFTNTQNQDNVDAKKIENGAGYVYFSDYASSKFLLSKLNDVEGLTYIIDGNYTDYQNLKNSLNVRCVENAENSCVGYCDYFSYSTFYCGKKVNVQMAFSMNKIYVGSPLILGCY